MNEILIGNISHLGNPDTFDKRILVLILKVGPRHWIQSRHYKIMNILLLKTSVQANTDIFKMSALFLWLAEFSVTHRSHERMWLW